MKKIFSICLSLLLASIVHAQGAYGDAQVFNVTYSDGGTWVTGTHSFTKNGYTFTITQGSDLRPTQSKGFENVNIDTPISKVTYTGALKCRGVEISEIAGLGQITLPFHNASSGSVRTIQTQIFDGNNWITVESISLPGNGFTLYRPSKVISKSAVKIKFVADGDFFFYGIDAYSHKDAANAANPPSLLSATPAENAIIPGAGSLFLQFDELIKEGSNLSVTLGNATITKTTFLGNTLQIDYTDFTNATNPLAVTKTSVADYSGTELSNNISVQYAIDITPPAQTDIAPADGSGIHVGDLGEYQRKIKITFDENIKIGTGSITFGSGTTYATVTATVDENILIVSYSGLPYNSTCVLTIPNGYVTDLSGNAWAGDTYTYTTGLRDTTPPELVETSVGENEELPVRGSISFSFDEIVVLGDAQATVDGQPVTLSNNGKVIGLNYTASSYYGTIIVTIPPGCVTDTCGNSYSGKSFDFLIEQKTPKAFNAVVASDGSGNYSTIQAAIDAITDDSQRTLIYVKAGTYSEKLCVWKNNVSLIGEDADKVFIVWDECASTSTLPPSEYGTGINTTGTDASFTMLITGNNFYGENFTVRNDYDYVAGTEANKQAVALEHKNGDKHVLKNVKMYSFQDTYYPKSPNTRQYLTGCYILGGTDFIFGSGTTFINNSEIYCYPDRKSVV